MSCHIQKYNRSLVKRAQESVITRNLSNSVQEFVAEWFCPETEGDVLT